MKKVKNFLAVLLSIISVAGMANATLAMYSGRSEAGTSHFRDIVDRDDRGYIVTQYILPMCFRYLVAVLKYEKYESPYRGAKQILGHCFWQMGFKKYLTLKDGLEDFISYFDRVHNSLKVDSMGVLSAASFECYDPWAFFLIGNRSEAQDQDYRKVHGLLMSAVDCNKFSDWLTMRGMSNVHSEIEILPEYQRWLEDLDIL